MEQNVVKSRGLLFSFALAVTIICVATALVCGGIILLNHLGAGSAKCSAREYYAVGDYYDGLSEAKLRAESERRSGRAGYVLNESAGFFLVSALFVDSADAQTVSERLGSETSTLKVSEIVFSGEDRSSSREALDTLFEVVEETEKIWRRLDAGETSESLTAKTLQSYATVVGGYKDADEGIGDLCVRVGALLTEAATGGKYPLSADVKYVSAATAALIAEYAGLRGGAT